MSDMVEVRVLGRSGRVPQGGNSPILGSRVTSFARFFTLTVRSSCDTSTPATRVVLGSWSPPSESGEVPF